MTVGLSKRPVPSAAPTPLRRPAPGASTVFVAFSKDPNPKVIALTMRAGGRMPETARKLALTDHAAAQISREARALDQLQSSHRLGDLLPTVPVVLQHDERSLTTTALPGRSMNAAYHGFGHTASRRRVADDFALVGAWLATFQTATAGKRAPIDLDGGRTGTLRERFAGRPQLDEDLTRLAAVHARLGRGSVARAFVHGDFWAGNVLTRRRAVTGVVDWEFARPDDDPLHDIARFALSYSLYLDRHTRAGHEVRGHRGLTADVPAGGIRYAIDGDGWYPTLVRRFISSALERLGAPDLAARDVLVAGVAAVAAEADDPDFAALHADVLHQLLADEVAA